MSELRDVITSDFEAIITEWPNVQNQTKAKITTMVHYYNNIRDDRSVVVEQTKRDRRNLQTNFNEHENLASRGSNIKRDLVTHVNTSKNRVQKLKKHGRQAAVGSPVLGAVIGGALGAEALEWGKVAAIAVGAILGFIVFAVVALFMYFFLRWKFTKSRDMWKRVESENQGGVELVGLIKRKKSCLSEIQNRLNDIEEDNMATALPMLLEKLTEYST